MFKKTPSPGEGGGNGGDGGNGGGDGGGDGGDGGGDGGAGDGDDGGEEEESDDGGAEEDEPADGETSPIVKGGNRKINIPKAENRANYSINEKSKERITMPNLDKKIVREINRLTKQLINSTKEFIEGGINYDGIDFVPDNEILTEDGQEFFEIVDFNSPGEVSSGMAEERLAEIIKAIQNVLDEGKRDSRLYNYAEYLNLFELRYNNNGTPHYRFSLEITGETLEDVIVTVLEEGDTLEDED